MEAKTLDELWDAYSRYNTITRDEYNSISAICDNERNNQQEIDKEKALKAFCLFACNCKECLREDTICQEYEKFEKIFDSL